MLRGLSGGTWNELGQSLGWPETSEFDFGVRDLDRAAINAGAATVAELEQELENVGGTLIVDATSSEFIVARNNRLKFSIEPDKTQPGMYKITSSNLMLYLLGGGALIFVIALVASH